MVHMLDSETAELKSLYLIIFVTLSLKCKEDWVNIHFINLINNFSFTYW